MSYPFEVVHKRDEPRWRSRGLFVTIGRADDLDEARGLRLVSGDIVVCAGTDRVVKDPSWLWEWERADPDSYANLQISNA